MAPLSWAQLWAYIPAQSQPIPIPREVHGALGWVSPAAQLLVGLWDWPWLLGPAFLDTLGSRRQS